MKKKTLAVMMLVTFMAICTACGSAAEETPAQEAAPAEEAAPAQEETSEEETSAQEEAPEEEAATAQEGEVSEGQEEEILETECRGFAKSLQESIGDRNMEDIAVLMSYPCYIGYGDGTDTTVETEEDFLALDAEKVFSDELVEAVKNADVDSIEMVAAGLVVGDESGKPNVTFGLGGDETVGIIGINN